MVSDSFVGLGHQLFNSVPFVPGYRCPPRPYGRMDSDLEPLKRSRWRPEWRGRKKKVLSTSRILQLLVVSQSALVMVWFFPSLRLGTKFREGLWS
ncbi:hypothetical protein CEXT_622121 [Caerostris extrusa]|uniref:Transmembrane protein n=1 Tax=Caerostris extrusa TaxID=172846 RepID=A0AAV4W8Q1_CAEEX|nr:hypothetical protein CEXT_622121 [Caerostris extrusa]